MPAIFSKAGGGGPKQTLQPISFGTTPGTDKKPKARNQSPIQSTAKATTLQMDPSYGFLPNSILDKDDLNVMDEIEKMDPNIAADTDDPFSNMKGQGGEVRQVTKSVTEKQNARKITVTGNYNAGRGSVLDDLDDDF